MTFDQIYAGMTPEQITAVRVIFTALGAAAGLALTRLWLSTAEEIRETGFNTKSSVLLYLTAALTVALGALAYLVRVM